MISQSLKFLFFIFLQTGDITTNRNSKDRACQSIQYTHILPSSALTSHRVYLLRARQSQRYLVSAAACIASPCAAAWGDDLPDTTCGQPVELRLWLLLLGRTRNSHRHSICKTISQMKSGTAADKALRRFAAGTEGRMPNMARDSRTVFIYVCGCLRHFLTAFHSQPNRSRLEKQRPAAL
jgi:hypothetical protein